MYKLLTLISLTLICSLGFAQNIPDEIKPPSWKHRLKKDVPAHVMPEFNLQKLKEEDAKNDLDKSKPWRFGFVHNVSHNLTNSGEWTTLPNGDRIWRIKYHSPGAYSLNFMFFDFEMP
ncbi:MAG: secretion system protein Por, partial [Flavobacteriales bacterium]|nr:secretion system protein Por [Flavobacteriales bacterium]